MNLKTVYGGLATAVTAIGAMMTFKPEIVFADSYSFFEYASSVLAVPLMAAGVFLMAVCGLLLLPGAPEAGRQILSWRDMSLAEVGRQILGAGKVSLAIAMVCLGVAAHETYFLARNTYSYARDQLFTQYRLESLSRHAVDQSLGNLYAARQGLLDFADRFKGAQSAADATRRAGEIDRMLAVKTVMATRARERDRTFGTNRTSVHIKAEALALHPWDSGLRAELEQDLARIYRDYLPAMLADVALCESPEKLVADRARLGRHFVLLGFERAVEAGIQGTKPEDWKVRFCQMFSGVPPERLNSIVDSIWQREAISKLLADSDPQLLQQRRKVLFAGLRRVESKWTVRLKGSRDEVEPLPEAGEREDDALLDVPAPPPMLKSLAAAAVAGAPDEDAAPGR